MVETFRYPTLHWLMTVVAAPVLLLPYVFVTEGPPGLAGDGMMMFWVFLVGGVVLSLPTYVLYFVAFSWLFGRLVSARSRRKAGVSPNLPGRPRLSSG